MSTDIVVQTPKWYLVVITGFRGLDPRDSYAFSYITRGQNGDDAHARTLAELERQHRKLTEGRYLLLNDELFMPIAWHYIEFSDELSGMYEEFERLKQAEKILNGEVAVVTNPKRSVICPIPKRGGADAPKSPNDKDDKPKK